MKYKTRSYHQVHSAILKNLHLL